LRLCERKKEAIQGFGEQWQQNLGLELRCYRPEEEEVLQAMLTNIGGRFVRKIYSGMYLAKAGVGLDAELPVEEMLAMMRFWCVD